MVRADPRRNPDLQPALGRERGRQRLLGRGGYDYYNFAETPAEANAVLPPDAYRRLREIKAHYDPDQAVISAHPVRPAGY
jgi:hypothetical protein